MTTRPRPTTPTTPIDAVRHTDTRVNIPTEELRDFVPGDDQHAPPRLYSRDPSLDPQLVWKGKDEQDAADLAVPVVPIYLQEKIHPQAIVEDIRAHARQGQPAVQIDLFSDFNGVGDFWEQVEFYRHEQHWTNRMILGDSLLAMTSLAEKEGLRGKVQCIYIDPPYGIKFGSNWQVSCNLTHRFAAPASLCFHWGQGQERALVMSASPARAARPATRPVPHGPG